MIPSRRLLLSACICLPLFISACASNDAKSTHQILETRENLKTEKDQVRVVDPQAKVASSVNKIEVRDIRTTTVGERMQITLLLKNNRGRRDVINVRMRWLDSAGLMAAQYDPWETVALEGMEEKTVTLNAPTPRAEDFRIEMQAND